MKNARAFICIIEYDALEPDEFSALYTPLRVGRLGQIKHERAKMQSAAAELAYLAAARAAYEGGLFGARSGGKASVNELKNRFEEKDLISAVEVIRGTGYLDRLIFISFSDFNCITMRRLLSEAKVQFLTTGEINGELITFLKKERLDLDIEYKRLTKENIALLHSENIEVNCWTVDDKKAAEDLAEWGVDYITSNILE